MDETVLHPRLDDYDGGLIPAPDELHAYLDGPGGAGRLMQAAPHWMGDGMTGDLMPYLSLYEVAVPGFKAAAEEPPYKAQTGNNCTSEGTSRGIDGLQFMAVAAEATHPRPDGRRTVFRRTAIEATYAFGLYAGGRRGDNGAAGADMAKAVSQIGVITYDLLGGAGDEDGNRLQQFANNPSAVVTKFGTQAADFKVGDQALIGSWEEYCALIANGGVCIVCSGVGYNTPRDAKGVCARRGRWMHCMLAWGVIRSDGVESAVICQSWGKNVPNGPQPFRLPSYAFRVARSDFEDQLTWRDTFGFRLFPGFASEPLPARWVNNEGWAA